MLTLALLILFILILIFEPSVLSIGWLPDDGHRDNNITVFAADLDVTEYIIGDTPDKVCDPVEGGLSVHDDPFEYCFPPGDIKLNGMYNIRQMSYIPFRLSCLNHKT